MNIKVKKLKENAKLPYRATAGSAGADIFACIPRDIVIPAGGKALVPSGIAIALESADYGAFLFPRSGLAVKHGITMVNCVGVIDSDYRGEVCVPLINLSDSSYTVHSGDRIAQLVIMPVAAAEFSECKELPDTDRGEGGFGSTGQ